MLEPKTYRKKPVEIEAWQLNRENAYDIVEWINESGGTASTTIYGHINIWTLEGKMKAETGDYVIQGVQGEFYPCKPDIFAETYEAVNTDGII